MNCSRDDLVLLPIPFSDLSSLEASEASPQTVEEAPSWGAVSLLDTPRTLSLTPRFSEVTLAGVRGNRFSGLGVEGNQKPLKRFES